jgi:NADH-quinone oxidoreductase subunit N
MMNWMAFGPELYFLVVAGVFLAVALLPQNPERDHRLAMALGGLGVGVCVAAIGAQADLFSNTYRIDLFSQVFKIMLAIGFFLVACICNDLPGVRDNLKTEFYLLLSICTLAMMLLVSSVNIIPLYVALEVSSYSLYILVAFRKAPPSGTNAAIKYFLVGASASALMLFGLARVYGAANTASIPEILASLPTLANSAQLSIGLFFVLCGFFFKLAVFPFHIWAPDVYEAAPNPLAAYIATVSKVVAVAMLIRISALAGTSSFFTGALATLAIVSMTLGNLAALAQKDLKRLFAYSSIAHGGYLLVGILCLSDVGYAGAIFYAMAVLVMKFTCFLAVVTVSANGGNPQLTDLAGLHKRAPMLSMALMLALFGLCGVPPTIGFTGKLMLFLAAMKKGLFTLVLIAMINVVISLYYYLQVLKAAYLTEPADGILLPHETLSVQVLSLVMTVAIVAAGVFPNRLIELALAAAHALS